MQLQNDRGEPIPSALYIFGQYCGNEFEWSLEHNIYTYETVRAMLDEIEECVHLLMSDFHNKNWMDAKTRSVLMSRRSRRLVLFFYVNDKKLNSRPQPAVRRYIDSIGSFGKQ